MGKLRQYFKPERNRNGTEKYFFLIMWSTVVSEEAIFAIIAIGIELFITMETSPDCSEDVQSTFHIIKLMTVNLTIAFLNNI